MSKIQYDEINQSRISGELRDMSVIEGLITLLVLVHRISGFLGFHVGFEGGQIIHKFHVGFQGFHVGFQGFQARFQRFLVGFNGLQSF